MIRTAVLLAFVASTTAFNLQPPANEWAKTGTTHELVCKSSEPVTTCSWDTPYEKNYNLKPIHNLRSGAGLRAESGRLEGFSNGENECGLRINTVEAKDDGVWACNVGVVEGSEVKSAKGQSRLNIAQKPKSVALMDVAGSTSGFVNVTDSGEVSVRCVVEAAMPEPSFSWILGEDLLEDAKVSTEQTSDDQNTWIQTLAYAPSADHHNRTLTCFAGHIGFEDGDDTSASALVQVGEGFTTKPKAADDDVVQSEPKTEETSGEMAGWKYAVILVVVLVLIVAVCVCLGTCLKRRGALAAGDIKQDEDLEKAEAEDADDEQKDEKKDEEKTVEKEEKEEETVKEPKEEEELEAAEVAAPPRACPIRKMLSSLKITRSAPTTNVPQDDAEAAKLTEEEEEVAKDETTKKTAGRFSIFKMIAKRSDKKQADTEDKEKAAVEEEGEKMVELEPEDKPEPEDDADKKVDEKAEEKIEEKNKTDEEKAAEDEKEEDEETAETAARAETATPTEDPQPAAPITQTPV